MPWVRHQVLTDVHVPLGDETRGKGCPCNQLMAEGAFAATAPAWRCQCPLPAASQLRSEEQLCPAPVTLPRADLTAGLASTFVDTSWVRLGTALSDRSPDDGGNVLETHLLFSWLPPCQATFSTLQVCFPSGLPYSRGAQGPEWHSYGDRLPWNGRWLGTAENVSQHPRGQKQSKLRKEIHFIIHLKQHMHF